MGGGTVTLCPCAFCREISSKCETSWWVVSVEISENEEEEEFAVEGAEKWEAGGEISWVSLEVVEEKVKMRFTGSRLKDSLEREEGIESVE